MTPPTTYTLCLNERLLREDGCTYVPGGGSTARSVGIDTISFDGIIVVPGIALCRLIPID